MHRIECVSDADEAAHATAARAFDGQSLSDVLAAVVRQEIDWSRLPADTPPRLRQLIARCLTADVRQRLRDIGEARIASIALLAAATVWLPNHPQLRRRCRRTSGAVQRTCISPTLLPRLARGVDRPACRAVLTVQPGGG